MMYGSSIFFGFRFFLSGFSPQHYFQEKTKILSEGGAVLEEYGPDCTHVVVHNLVYDDPICVAARRDGKTLVTSLWLEQSFDYGELVDAAYIMYRPPKELTGIPGSKELIICLTGYQGPTRDEMKMLVHLMGAQFSKPLIAHKVTHLLCYKFEGEKYELAKKMGFTKLVNHHWVIDCLKAWKVLPEEPYSKKSGYEVDMMEAVVKDSEDETGDIAGRDISETTNLQNEMREVQNHSVAANKVSMPSTRQGLSNSSTINDQKLLKSDSESRSVNKLDKQLAWGNRDQYQVVSNSNNADEQNVAFFPSNQIGNGLPSTSGNAKNSGDIDAEKFNSFNYSTKTPTKTSLPLYVGEDLEITNGANSKRLNDSDTGNCSPLFSKKTPRSRASLQPGKSGKSKGRLEYNPAGKKIPDVPTFNIESDKDEAASGCVGVLSSERQADSDSDKHSPVNSRKSSKTSTPSLSNLDEKLGKSVCNSDQSNAASAFGVSGTKVGLSDEKSPAGLLPQKRTANSQNASHATPKSQKLATSASKRVDAAEPRTPVNKTLEERKTGVINAGSNIGDESARLSAGRPSPYILSTKSSGKNVAPSRSLAFKIQPDSKNMNSVPLTSPNTSRNSTIPDPGDNNGEPQNLHHNGVASLVTNHLETVKSASPELNSGGQTGTSVLKPPRKKMVARKTLGSRPKASKKTADAQSSVSGNSFQVDTAEHPVHQENREERSLSPAAYKVFVPPSVDEPVGPDINDHAELLEDETEAPPALDVDNEKLQTAELSHLVKSSTGEASDMLLCVTDGAEATQACDKTCGQGMPVAAILSMKKNLVPQKKGNAVKAKKKSVVAAKEVAKIADKAEGDITSDRVKKQGVGSAAKERHGTLLLDKTKRPVVLEKDNELVKVGKQNDFVHDDQHANKGVKHAGKLDSKKRCGTLLLKKSRPLAQVENEIEPDFSGDVYKNRPGKLAATSNTTQGEVEAKNKNDPGVSNRLGTSKVAKCAGKLAGKKRRGTLKLEKSDGPDKVEKENVPVLHGEQHPGKQAATSGIFDRSLEVENENELILGNNQGANMGGQCAGKLAGKKRRGTLVLNKSEVPVDEGEKNKSVLDDDDNDADDDEDKSKGRILPEKLPSDSSLTAYKSDTAKLNSLNIHEMKDVKTQPAYFILSGHRLQRKEFQQLIKRLKGKVCRDSHQWSYQASHFIVPDPIRRTEKFFAAAASGSWILKTDYLTESSQAGKLLPEEPYEWHKNGLSEDGAISLEAPRKWRLLRERTGHGAFHGMQIVIYGECIAPPLDTLKRVVKAGDGTILATSPPYTRYLESGVDFAIVSPGMPRVDIWVQEFLRHQIPCVLADYIVEYVCKPGYSLDRHVQYNTHEWAAKSFSKLLSSSEEVIDPATPDDQVSEDLACQVCGSTDRAEVMLVCGNETGFIGCGIGMHIDCCNPPLEDIPEEDWFCPKCTDSNN